MQIFTFSQRYAHFMIADSHFLSFSGDITLSFYGNHMASVYNPLLVIKYNNVTYIQVD